jgi:FMN phosphatase YigB (HAD superfamily)
VKYRAVIFDLWATLVPWDQEGANRFYDAMAEAAGVEESRFREAWLSGRKSREVGPIVDYLHGLFDELSARSRTSTRSSTCGATDRSGRCNLDQTRSETLAELRRRGHLLGLISVCSQDVPHVWAETPFAGALDEVVLV